MRPAPQWLRTGLALIGQRLRRGVMIIAIGGGAVAAASSQHASWAALAEAALPRETVYFDIVGRRAASPVAIAAALEREGDGTPALLSLDRLRSGVERVDGVAEVSLRAHLDGRLVVRLTERQAVAIWSDGAAARLIDALGAPAAGASEAALSRMLVVDGSVTPGSFANLWTLLRSEPELHARVVGATARAYGRWDVRLTDGSIIRLPVENMAISWARTAELVRSLPAGQKLGTVDARLPDRLIFQPPPAPEATGQRRGGRE